VTVSTTETPKNGLFSLGEENQRRKNATDAASK
jgi:hypothetical protein